jgi:hypothetical protein
MRNVPKSIQKELMTLGKRPDAHIDFSDIPESKRIDWVGAVRGKFFRPQKRRKPKNRQAD